MPPQERGRGAGTPRPHPRSPERRDRADRPTRADRPARPDRSDRPQRPDRDPARRPRVPEPPLPPDVAPSDLDRSARAELRSLPADLADKVAGHLVAAGLLLVDDPATAHAHAWYARGLAPRLAVVREAAGLTAYRIGDYAAALTELRAVRRMTGDPAHLPVMADAERGLGRPDRALALARDPDAGRLEPAQRVELAIVVSGARRDRGEYDAAVVGLQGPALDSDRIQPWTPRLWYAYADALHAAGRRDEAVRWFESVVTVDEEGETDAEDRLAELTS